jgi:hypothetical protein
MQKKSHHRETQEFSFELKYKLCDYDYQKIGLGFMTILLVKQLIQKFRFKMKSRYMILCVRKKVCGDQTFKKNQKQSMPL